MTQALQAKLTAFGETLKKDSKEHNPIRPAAAWAIVEHWDEIKAIMGAVDDPEFAEYDRLKRKFEGA